MKQTLLFLCFFFFMCEGFAQQQPAEGMVTFRRTSYWTKIQNRMTYLSQEEKDRNKMTFGNDDDWKQDTKLLFSPTKSLYTHLKDEAESEDGQYRWRQDDYVIVRDFSTEKATDLIEMLGKTYLFEDSLKTPSWKILNQIKEVAGFICMKAETFDTVKNQKITAWFANDIPVSAGPERYMGLPGLILELDLNDGDVTVVATKVDFRSVENELKPPKMKGKKINQTEYDRLLTQHIKDSIKSRRNPFWSLRY